VLRRSVSRLLIAPIRFYRRVLSPLKGVPTCRYLPTCSEYAIEAIQKRGPVVGLLKALWRLLRCNPLFRGGFDPVDPLPPTPGRPSPRAPEHGHCHR
jgi:putative membrane protein insertion efficiency factor